MSGILVAGVGNVFLGDDGFGVEVVRRLREKRGANERDEAAAEPVCRVANPMDRSK